MLLREILGNKEPSMNMVMISIYDLISELESNSTLFDLEPEVKLNLTTMRSREFYLLFVNKSYAEEQTGVKRWNKMVTMDKKSWHSAFTSVRTTSKDMNLREFHFKFLYRTTVKKKRFSGLD